MSDRAISRQPGAAKPQPLRAKPSGPLEAPMPAPAARPKAAADGKQLWEFNTALDF